MICRDTDPLQCLHANWIINPFEINQDDAVMSNSNNPTIEEINKKYILT